MFVDAAAAAARSWLGAAVLAGALAGSPLAANSVVPPDASGTWAITETRAGQKCTATLCAATSNPHCGSWPATAP